MTGGAGFLGSHLCDALIKRGDAVVCVNNFVTGRMENVAHLFDGPDFLLIETDVSADLEVPGHVDGVAHFASPASPPDYLRLPLATLAVGSRGTENAVSLAGRHGARFILASTSEVYGDPAVHPQPEDYWGNVNPIGPRSVYDESKRFAEALTTAYGEACGFNVGIVRIFNTFGPRMSARDGRIVTNFITQALNGEPLTVYGDGGQTRSFCYVDDLVRGIVAMLDSSEHGPVNLGNPEEFTVANFARLVLQVTESSSPIEYRPLPVDDPVRRCPVISRARETLGWGPMIHVEEGLRRTVEWFLGRPDEVRSVAAGGGRLARCHENSGSTTSS